MLIFKLGLKVGSGVDLPYNFYIRILAPPRVELEIRPMDDDSYRDLVNEETKLLPYTIDGITINAGYSELRNTLLICFQEDEWKRINEY